MLQRDSIYTLGGTVEMDEIFIGGKQSLDERRSKGDNKTPFLIAVEENSKGGPRFLSFEELESIYEEQVVPAIKKNVRYGSTIKSDGSGVYVKAQKEGYKHERFVEMREPEKNTRAFKVGQHNYFQFETLSSLNSSWSVSQVQKKFSC